MPVFSYKALALSGRVTEGEEVSASEAALRELLVSRGLRVQQLRERRSALVRLARRRVVRPEQFLLFNHELTALLHAGLTLPEALQLAAVRPEAPSLGQTLSAVLQEVRNGTSLSDACAARPEVFDPLFVSAVRTGEHTGNLHQALGRYQNYLKHRIALNSRLSQAMAYPAFLLITMAVILAALFIFVLPRFISIYADFNAQLPWPTRVLVAIVDHLPLTVAVIAVLAGAGWAVVRWLRRRPERWSRLQRWRETLPLIGPLQRMIRATRMARTLATLIASGTPLVQAMQTAHGALPPGLDADRLDAARRLVLEGSSLAAAFEQTGMMPATAVKMVQVGETSGRLDAMLEEIARFYEELLEGRLAKALTLIEPALMLLIGVFVGGIIIVMYLPIFSLAEVIK